jgi:hypothetical protein
MQEEEEGAAAVLEADEQDYTRKLATSDVPRRWAVMAGVTPGEDKERVVDLLAWIGKVWPRHPPSLELILIRTLMAGPGWHSERQSNNNKRKNLENRRRNKSMREEEKRRRRKSQMEALKVRNAT